MNSRIIKSREKVSKDWSKLPFVITMAFSGYSKTKTLYYHDKSNKKSMWLRVFNISVQRPYFCTMLHATLFSVLF